VWKYVLYGSIPVMRKDKLPEPWLQEEAPCMHVGTYKWPWNGGGMQSPQFSHRFPRPRQPSNR
jgi:hypothetical protein